MPLPIIIPIFLAVGGIFGAVKTIVAAKDMNEAKETNELANGIIEEIKQKQSKQKRLSKASLHSLAKTKMKMLSTTMSEFITTFEKLKDVDFTDSVGLDELKQIHEFMGEIKETKELAQFAMSALTGGAAGVGLGILTAWGAYGVTTAFAVAGTGTAISTLGGIAATNATLAWIGGGTIAAGGLGVAGGATILGVMVAGPAIAIMGIVMGAKASQMLDDANANIAIARKAEKEVNIICCKLKDIQDHANFLKRLIKDVDKLFSLSITSLKKVIEEHGVNWGMYDKNAKQTVFACVKLAQIQKMLLDVSILEDTGELSSTYKASTLQIEHQVKPYGLCYDKETVID